MRIYAIAVFLFLYVPIGIIVLFSFNAGRHASELRGLSVQWYGKALSNPFVMDAFVTSLIVAFSVAVLSSLMGTTAALALQRLKGTPRILFDGLIYISVMIPGIVIGIATLVALVTVFDFLNPLLAAAWPEGTKPPKLHMGYASVIAAHTLFTMSLVIILVRARIAGMDRALIEASMDLYATAANLPGHTGGFPAQLHLQLRRFHHFLFRRRRQYHAADLHFRVDPPRHHAGSERHWQHGACSVAGVTVDGPVPAAQALPELIVITSFQRRLKFRTYPREYPLDPGSRPG
jgi:hypothetical protein